MNERLIQHLSTGWKNDRWSVRVPAILKETGMPMSCKEITDWVLEWDDRLPEKELNVKIQTALDNLCKKGVCFSQQRAGKVWEYWV